MAFNTHVLSSSPLYVTFSERVSAAIIPLMYSLNYTSRKGFTVKKYWDWSELWQTVAVLPLVLESREEVLQLTSSISFEPTKYKSQLSITQLLVPINSPANVLQDKLQEMGTVLGTWGIIYPLWKGCRPLKWLTEGIRELPAFWPSSVETAAGVSSMCEVQATFRGWEKGYIGCFTTIRGQLPGPQCKSTR